MTEHAVVIAGGGPTGMMLAAELALASVDVAVVERRTGRELVGTRSRGFHSRTIEVLDQRGVAERFLEAGQTAQVGGFAWLPLDIGDLPTRHPYGLAQPQHVTERILGEWIAELGVPVFRGTEVTGFAQDTSGVDVSGSDGRSFRARYLVGCDGGRSTVRKAAGIAFAGWDPTVSHILAEAEMTQEAEWGLKRDARGLHSLSRLEDGTVAIMVTERSPGRTAEPTLQDLGDALIAIWGTDFGLHSPRWISRFDDMARQAAAYRQGRVLLAGDAAHVHYPTGGQGLGTGLQDAVNLGWKLAQVVTGASPESLLDSYQAERHPVGATVLRSTMAQSALLRSDPQTEALRAIVGDLLGMDQPRRHLGALMSGLGIAYDLGEGHPLLGRRMPDLDVSTPEGPRRVYEYLHDARPVVLDLGRPGSLDIAGWSDRVQLATVGYSGAWELPGLGSVSPPGAVLVRPDGYVAWVGDGTSAGLPEALLAWFGPPTA
jgi:2-polyprenyl-6-methoxyphenol hydroxylase-like FAD-dependent oxidoreductase